MGSDAAPQAVPGLPPPPRPKRKPRPALDQRPSQERFARAEFSATGARQKLVALNDAFLAKCRAEAEEFRLYAEYADEYRFIPEESPVLAGTERLMTWGGDGFDPDCPARGQRGHTCGTVTVDPEQLLPRAQLFVHLSEATLRAGEGLMRVEKAGGLLADWVKELNGNTRVTVRPVLHPDQLATSDSYEVPARMREWVTLRNTHEAFPFSQRPSRGLDLDHTIPWRPTPAGQEPLTRPDNLAPLSRKVHRAKTHGGWHLSQPLPGTFLWRSPLRFGYLVTRSHTWLVEDPTGRILPRPDDGEDSPAA
ncbi:HNH endonuclease signature motif containing protein [Propionibacteriaceae bacterium Y1923]|uniref:HNH endonuclease signature motif containing protein n=1 Tax=Aestuariimicrobium sp. Y1814 TaxID=3418742 RepID=UPI003C1855AC